jgi:hypothetical protein
MTPAKGDAEGECSSGDPEKTTRTLQRPGFERLDLSDLQIGEVEASEHPRSEKESEMSWKPK